VNQIWLRDLAIIVIQMRQQDGKSSGLKIVEVATGYRAAKTTHQFNWMFGITMH
jgi:hypothetical protein